MKTNSFVEKCTSIIATDPNVIFNPFCTSSPKNKKMAFKNFKPSENNKTKILEIMSRNLLIGDKHNGSFDSKSSAKFKAQNRKFFTKKN